MNVSAASAARAAAVSATMDRVKAIEREHGVTRPALEAQAGSAVATAGLAVRGTGRPKR